MPLRRKDNNGRLNREGVGPDFLFESSGTYRIRVLGSLEDACADHLGGMIITRAFTSDQRPMTILIGHIEDQGALSGILTALYDLRLPLVTVELLSIQCNP